MDMMTDEQVRRFICNLCNYTKGNEVELPTELEKALWIGVLPSLKINDLKYEKVVERNRENGKLGGAPLGNQNARKNETTQNNPNNPISDKRKMTIDKREVVIENREVINENCESIKDNRQEPACEISCLKNENPFGSETPIENLEQKIIPVRSDQSFSSNIQQGKRPPTNLLLDIVRLMDTNNEIPQIFYEVVRKKEEEGWMKLSPKEAVIFIDNKNLFNNFLDSIPEYKGVKLV